jgi:hypothetical protein
VRSDKVPYYILDLLQQVPSVFVPGLGRFDAIFHPAVIDPDKSRIHPPRMEASFTHEDKDEASLLPSYMHYVSGIGKNRALDFIREFVAGVHDHLEHDQPYEVDKFGTFSKSTLGVIHFTPDWDAFNLSFRGLETLHLQSLSPESRSEVSKPQGESLAEVPLLIEDRLSDNASSESSWVTDREPETPETEIALPHPVTESSISDSTSRLWWMILATALLLITVLCVYLAWDILSNRDRINQYTAITNRDLSTSSPDVIITDTLDFVEEEIPFTDTQSTQQPAPDQITEPVIEPSNTIICHVVVGAFTNPDNVVRMEKRLKEMGYTSEQIKGGSLTRVAIRTSCDQESLQKTLQDARATINPEAWIY